MGDMYWKRSMSRFCTWSERGWGQWCDIKWTKKLTHLWILVSSIYKSPQSSDEWKSCPSLSTSNMIQREGKNPASLPRINFRGEPPFFKDGVDWTTFNGWPPKSLFPWSRTTSNDTLRGRTEEVSDLADEGFTLPVNKTLAVKQSTNIPVSALW